MGPTSWASVYLGRRDPDTFDTLIQVKTNAVELLRKELSRLEPDVIARGDWQQPAEDRYRLSRRMLEVVCDLRFPLFVVERSPLLTRDLEPVPHTAQDLVLSWRGRPLSDQVARQRRAGRGGVGGSTTRICTRIHG